MIDSFEKEAGGELFLESPVKVAEL